MLVEEQIKYYRSLNKWFQTPLGNYLAQEFYNELKRFDRYLEGDILLQLGHCGDNIWLPELNFKRHWVASPFALNHKSQLLCAFDQLPFSRNSLDCILAPLTIEPFKNSLSLLDEIDRVLKPMGYVIFLSLNPWSLWGLTMRAGMLHCYHNSDIKMRSAYRINRILQQRGYKQCSLTSLCYIPPINNSLMINKMTFIDEMGRMLWPFPAGYYCYIAQKHEVIMPNLSYLAEMTEENEGLQPAL